jgi:para-nitrobenzyl esterase
LAATATLASAEDNDRIDQYLVRTREGPVQGFAKNGIAEYLGIPYATPPVGDLRWRPPQEHAPWTKVLQATTYGPTCAQSNTLALFAGPLNNNEDCLYLNIFTSKHVRDERRAREEKLPVIVWIHGGGNFDGESNDYDGSKLAARGAVVVTLNYRLGVMGFFAHPAIDGEGHFFGNYGLLDQQMVLKWVQNNIARFGGDPDNVTLGGQSAGSEDTESNVISPLAKGLFHRAIFQSVIQEPKPLPTAESIGASFAFAVGCGSGATPAVAQCLRNLSVAQIMALQGNYLTGPAGMIADGQVLPSDPFVTTIKAGRFNHMPIMSGTTEDEWNFILAIQEYYKNPRVPFSPADYAARINGYVGSETQYGSGVYPAGTPAAVAAHYPLAAYPTPQLAINATMTDQTVCGQRYTNRLFATQVPLYAYEFRDRTAPFYFPPMPGFQSLAYHTGDIQYLFPLYHGGPQGIAHSLNRQQDKLSDELVTAWTNFASSGNPNWRRREDRALPLYWPRYNPSNPSAPTVLSQNIPALSTFSDAQFAAAHQCNFWDSILTY